MSNLQGRQDEEAEFDPNAPLIGSDGLEYACFADKLLNRPLDSWRNKEILTRRARHEPEENIRIWIKAYDGEAYDGPIQLDRKTAQRDRDYAIRWHDHCCREARRRLGLIPTFGAITLNSTSATT